MLIFGIDVGTTGTKAAIIDEKGCVLGKGYQEYSLITTPEGGVEQNAEDWWDATVYAVRTAIKNAAVSPGDIAAVSFSTQGGTTVAVDEKIRPLRNADTWMDRKAQKECQELCQTIGEDSVYRKTGWQPNPAFDPAKIRRLKSQESEVYKKAAYYLTTPEYIAYKMTGRLAIDPTNAAMRQIFNINAGAWDQALLDFAQIEPRQLPEVLPTGEEIGALTNEAAEILGLLPGVRVFNGAHDQYCAAIGSGAVNTGDMLLSTGTTWVVVGVTDKPLFTENFLSPGIHPCKGKYGNIASLRSAGSALKWLKSLCREDFATIDAEAEKRRESAQNLLYYPYYAGAGFPHNNDRLNACVMGMELRHDQFDLSLALMEGVAFETRQVLDAFAETGGRISALKMVGGATNSPVWSKLTCNITGCGIRLAKEPDTCCVGAAMLAAVGVGLYKDFDSAVNGMVQYAADYLPEEETAAFYTEKFERYKKGLSALKNI